MSNISSALKVFGTNLCNIYAGACVVVGTAIMIKGAYDVLIKQKTDHFKKVMASDTSLTEEDMDKINNDYDMSINEDGNVVLTRKETI